MSEALRGALIALECEAYSHFLKYIDGQDVGVGTWGPVAPSPAQLDCTGDAAMDSGQTEPMVAPPPRRGV